MASFEIRWKRSAGKELKRLPKEAIERYRIIYNVLSRILTIEVVRVCHRKDVYRNLP